MNAPDNDAWPRFGKRMLAKPAPDAWIGIIARVVPETIRRTRDGDVRTPEHFLGAVWRPATHGPAHFPECVVIGSPDAGNALALLFEHLPRSARLYLAAADDVDAALAAEILLAADRNLEPYQRESIARFAEAERERNRERIKRIYTDRDPRYERFRDSVLGKRAL